MQKRRWTGKLRKPQNNGEFILFKAIKFSHGLWLLMETSYVFFVFSREVVATAELVCGWVQGGTRPIFWDETETEKLDL